MTLTCKTDDRFSARKRGERFLVKQVLKPPTIVSAGVFSLLYKNTSKSRFKNCKKIKLSYKLMFFWILLYTIITFHFFNIFNVFRCFWTFCGIDIYW